MASFVSPCTAQCTDFIHHSPKRLLSGDCKQAASASDSVEGKIYILCILYAWKTKAVLPIGYVLVSAGGE